MRRVVPYILVGLGFFLLFLGPFMRLYALPRVEKVPLDTYSKDVAVGSGSYFNLHLLRVVGPVPLRNIGVTNGDVRAGSTSVVVLDRSSITQDMSMNGVTIDAGKDRYVFDRVSGQAVHCCGETPRHEGLTLKFPFNTERRTYQFWDGTAGHAYPMVYTGEGEIAGIKVYTFVQHIGPTLTGSVAVSGSFAGTPNVDRVYAFFQYVSTTHVSVDPVTGAIISGDQHAVRTLIGPDGRNLLVVADTTLGAARSTIESTAEKAKGNLFQLNMVRTYIPIFGPIAGIVLIVLGMRLVRAKRTQAIAAAAPATAQVAG